MTKIIFYLTCLLIAYGSLYPFNFSWQADPDKLNTLLSTVFTSGSIGDVFGNIALFVPFGFFGLQYYRSLYQHRNKILGHLLLSGFLLAFIVQIIQLYIPSRSAAIYDVYWNALGLAIGAMMAKLAGHNPRFLAMESFGLDDKIAIVLVLLWFSANLVPFVPTLDWQSQKNALKPLLTDPVFKSADFIFLSWSWLIAGYLAKSVLQKKWRNSFLPLGIAGTLILKVFIVANQVTISDITAGLVVLVAWPLVQAYLDQHKANAAWFLLGGFILKTLMPLSFVSDPNEFYWMPFAGFLNGSMIVNTSSLCEKLFVFGAMVWMFEKAGGLRLGSIILVTFAILCSEMLQIFLEARTPEITDVLLFVLAAWLLLKSKQSGSHVPSTPKPKPISAGMASVHVRNAAELLLKYQVASDAVPVALTQTTSPKIKPVIWVAASIVLSIAFCLYTLLHIPGIPYNFRELFLFNGSGPDLLIFSIAILAIGWGSVWLGRVTASSAKPYADMPLAAIKVSLGFYLLVFASVTKESIMDVAGSAHIVWRIHEQRILGELGVKLVDAMGAEHLQSVAEIFEPIVRFGSLFAPMIIISGAIYAALFHVAESNARSVTAKIRKFLGKLGTLLFFMLPWLFLCKVISFDQSSTDNLNELFAKNGEYGLGGGGYIYLLLLLIALGAALVAWPIRKNPGLALMVLAASMASLPLGWLLINAGLTENVGKYGLNYSGVDFLLGPDRTHKLPESELFLRWSILQASAIIALATGAGLYLSYYSAGTVRQIRPPLPSRVKGSGSSHEIQLRLNNEHIDFLVNVSTLLGSSLSGTVNALVAYIKADLDSSERVRELVFDEIKQQSRAVPAGASSSSVVLNLSNQAFKTILGLQVETAVERSQLVLKLIQLFFVASKMEDK